MNSDERLEIGLRVIRILNIVICSASIEHYGNVWWPYSFFNSLTCWAAHGCVHQASAWYNDETSGAAVLNWWDVGSPLDKLPQLCCQPSSVKHLNLTPTCNFRSKSKFPHSAAHHQHQPCLNLKFLSPSSTFLDCLPSFKMAVDAQRKALEVFSLSFTVRS